LPVGLLAMMTPPRAYDVEADWTLLTTCNYRCAYCFHSPARLAARIRPPASVERLAAFFDGTGLTWLLHLTGGEPFHYPDFVELCRLLTRRHRISINTNADSRRVLEFAATIDPRRVDFVNCAVHFEERIARRRLEPFVRHVQALRAAGFDAYLTSVMHPEAFGVFVEQWDRFDALGLPIWPKAFRGLHAGRRYPDAYSPEERRIFVEYSLRAETRDRDRRSAREEPPTIDPRLDRTHFLHGVRSYRGALCDAGRAFVRIEKDGAIHPCSGRESIGHLVEGRFERFADPKPCAVDFCPYYCEKYSATGSARAGPGM
jgi:MoaA/NifB/PqqE/SkfB family radical SAM enzyme